MKTKIIIILIVFLPFSGRSYTWELLGPDSANISDICFGVAMPYWVMCADDGMYLYNYGNQETTFFTYGNLPVIGAAHLNAEKFIVLMGNDSYSDGIYTFDIQTQQFEVIEWIINPAFLYYNEQNATYYAGFHLGGLYTSTDGLTWNEMPFFADKSCDCMCSYGDHLAVSDIGDVNNNNIYFSNDAGQSWTPSDNSPPTFDLQFNQDGILYAVFPECTMSSGLYKSYDYGNYWDIEFWSFNLSTVGFDVFGNKFVGWQTQNTEFYGLAHYEMDSVWEPSFTLYNEGLGNIFINRIRTNPTMSAPALFVCTEGGVYYSYDIMVGSKHLDVKKLQIEIFPNPATSSGLLNILLPETFENIQILLFNNKGDKEFETIIDNNLPKQHIQIQLPEVSAGVYYCHIKSNNGSIVKKLVIR